MRRPTAEVVSGRGADTVLGFGRRFPFWRGSGCAGQIGWLARQARPAANVSAQFAALNATAFAGGAVLPAHAKDFVYLCVGGIFSDRVPRAYYFKENLEALKGEGLDARRVQIDSLAGVATNARVIRDAVLAATLEGKKVVLIGHSKGGLDCAAALAMHPEVAAKTHALITMQSPYAGSPVAQDIADDPLQKNVATLLLEKVIRGNRAMAEDLTYSKRQEFLARYALPEGLNVVSLATVDSDLLSVNRAPNDYIRLRYRKASDGLVVPEDALLPNSRYALAEGLDHLSTTCPSAQRTTYTPASITKALVAIALS